MKKQKFFLVLTTMLCACFFFAACGAPQTSDTSAVAGVYYQHAGDLESGARLDGKWIKLNSNGTWETGEGENKTSHTFTIEGTAISIYFGAQKMMYGTLQNGKLELTVFVIVGWQDVVFFKDAE